ncbi:Gfo/Idh/MocA family protein [Actinomadura geliboluensis]
MRPPPLRMGLLGCADIAWRNALPAMERVPDVALVACASRDRAKAERFAARFGGDALAGYEELLARPDVDAVYVPLPSGLHHLWGRRALEAGKHVLLEKPAVTSAAEAADLAALAGGHGLWVGENFTFVHHAQHRAVRRLIDEGAIGEPRGLRAVFGIPPRPPGDIRYDAELGGGALLDLGSYVVRAAQLLLGDELSVLGSMLRMAGDLGVDVGGNALLCSADGVPAELMFSFETGYRSAQSIWGAHGRLTLERAFTTPPTLRTVARVERQDHVEEITLPADDQFAAALRAFAGSVRALGASGDGEHRLRRSLDALLRRAALLDEIRERAHVVDVDGPVPAGVR